MPALTARGTPASPQVHLKRYSSFRGVDFSSDPSQVDDRRSPWAPNLISDAGGFPEKRLGWRTLHTFDGPVNGIFFYRGTQQSHMLCHEGTRLWLCGEDGMQLLREGLFSGRSSAFAMGGKLWILTGGQYLAYDGDSVCDAAELAYVPITSLPGSSSSRVSYQAVNLLTPLRKNLFIGDGEQTEFTLDAPCDENGEVTAWVNGEQVTGVSASGSTVTFDSPPAAAVPAGVPNITVQFPRTVQGAAQRVTGCTVCALYIPFTGLFP